MKILAAHQSSFLPWLGFFKKIHQADVFIWLHDIQFEKNNYQNRVQLANINGEKFWLTMPLSSYKFGQKINEIRINANKYRTFLKDFSKTIKQYYSKCKYYDSFNLAFPMQDWENVESDLSLDLINSSLLEEILCMLYGKYLAERLRVHYQNHSMASRLRNNDMLIFYCNLYDCDTYLSGSGAKSYLDEKKFNDAGIKVKWLDTSNLIYEQKNVKSDFVPGLSIIDALMNCPKKEITKLFECEG